MRTIGSKWPKSAPLSDYSACCSYCGVRWRRSQLRRDAEGKLKCPDEGDGMTALEQDRKVARYANERTSRRVRYRNDGGSFDKTSGE